MVVSFGRLPSFVLISYFSSVNANITLISFTAKNLPGLNYQRRDGGEATKHAPPTQNSRILHWRSHNGILVDLRAVLSICKIETRQTRLDSHRCSHPYGRHLQEPRDESPQER